MMVDSWPRGKRFAEWSRSGKLERIRVPASGALVRLADALSQSVAEESINGVRKVCVDLAGAFSDFYGVEVPRVRVLASPRPHSTLERRLASQLFGDYHLTRATIRIWSRTAMKRRWTSPNSIL